MAVTPELLDRGAYLPDADALVCADLHLGRATTGRVELPLGQLTSLPDRVETLAERFAPDQIVLAGDVLDSFSSVPRGVPDAVDALVAVASDLDAELRMIRGNHDTLLSRVYDGPIEETVRLDDGTVVCHGHEDPEVTAERYVIGHDHPAITVEGQRRPCYLSGPGPDSGSATEVLVLPAFTPLAAGMTVNGVRGEDFQSPLVADVDRFRPAIRDPELTETLWFPPLGSFRQLL
jgi:putative SbcD/Mre11-related phosphoesterase